MKPGMSNSPSPGKFETIVQLDAEQEALRRFGEFLVRRAHLDDVPGVDHQSAVIGIREVVDHCERHYFEKYIGADIGCVLAQRCESFRALLDADILVEEVADL
jgi:hypothetical protein